MLVHEMGEQHSGRSISFQEMLLIYIYIYVKLLYDMELYHVIPPNIWLYSGERSPKATLDRKSSWWRHRLKECKIVFHICHLRFESQKQELTRQKRQQQVDLERLWLRACLAISASEDNPTTDWCLWKRGIEAEEVPHVKQMDVEPEAKCLAPCGTRAQLDMTAQHQQFQAEQDQFPDQFSMLLNDHCMDTFSMFELLSNVFTVYNSYFSNFPWVSLLLSLAYMLGLAALTASVSW